MGKGYKTRGGVLNFCVNPEELKRAANDQKDISRNREKKKMRLTAVSFEWPNAGDTGHWAG